MEGVNGNYLFLISGKHFSFSLESHCHDYPFLSPRKHIMMYTSYSIFIPRDSKQNFSTPHNFCMFSGKWRAIDSLIMSKGESEAVNWKTEHDKQRKGQTIIYKTLYRKLQIEKHEAKHRKHSILERIFFGVLFELWPLRFWWSKAFTQHDIIMTSPVIKLKLIVTSM